MEYMEDISDDMAEFMRQRDAYFSLLDDNSMLTGEESGLLAQNLISFENCHIAANKLFNRSQGFI